MGVFLLNLNTQFTKEGNKLNDHEFILRCFDCLLEIWECPSKGVTTELINCLDSLINLSDSQMILEMAQKSMDLNPKRKYIVLQYLVKHIDISAFLSKQTELIRELMMTSNQNMFSYGLDLLSKIGMKLHGKDKDFNAVVDQISSQYV